MNFLDRVVESTRARVETEYRGYTPPKPDSPPVRHSLVAAIRDCSGVPIIGEVKPASPSAGWIYPEVEAGEVAVKMIQGGAVGVSVLTEPSFFHGSIENLVKVRGAVDAPVLMKDFVVDERQIHKAYEIGADSILLITSICPHISKFYELALTLGIEPLIEIHNKDDLSRVAPFHPRLIGINNRDLETLKVNLNRTKELAPAVQRSCPEALVVSESGIETAEDVRFVLESGADAVLVGTSVMRSKDIVAKVRELVEALIHG